MPGTLPVLRTPLPRSSRRSQLQRRSRCSSGACPACGPPRCTSSSDSSRSGSACGRTEPSPVVIIGQSTPEGAVNRAVVSEARIAWDPSPPVSGALFSGACLRHAYVCIYVCIYLLCCEVDVGRAKKQHNNQEETRISIAPCLGSFLDANFSLVSKLPKAYSTVLHTKIHERTFYHI